MNGDDFTVAPLTVLRNVENFIGVPEFFKENHFNFTGIYRFIHILKNYMIIQYLQEEKVILASPWLQMVVRMKTKPENIQNFIKKH